MNIYIQIALIISQHTSTKLNYVITKNETRTSEANKITIKKRNETKIDSDQNYTNIIFYL